MMLFSSKQGAAIPLSENFITRLMPQAPGDFVKVYVYGLFCLMRRRDVTLPEFCATLGVTQELAVLAFEYWQDCGAVRIKNGSSLSFEYLPVAEASAARLNTHSDFNAALRKLLAPRELTSSELNKIYDYTDTFMLPQEVVLMLVEYSVGHAGKNVSTTYMDKVAKSWAEEGINTPDLAVRKLTAQQRGKHPACAVLEKLGMGGRQPTQPETELYDKWIKQWGFDKKAVLRVCDYTIYSRNPSLGFLDRKLTELRQKEALTVSAVEAAFAAEERERGEKKPASRAKKPQADFAQRDYDKKTYDTEGVVVLGGDDK